MDEHQRNHETPIENLVVEIKEVSELIKSKPAKGEKKWKALRNQLDNHSEVIIPDFSFKEDVLGDYSESSYDRLYIVPGAGVVISEIMKRDFSYYYEQDAGPLEKIQISENKEGTSALLETYINYHEARANKAIKLVNSKQVVK